MFKKFTEQFFDGYIRQSSHSIHTSSSACKDWNSVRKTTFYSFYLFNFYFLFLPHKKKKKKKESLKNLKKKSM